MTTIEKHETLVEALCAAALDMEYVDKGQKNQHEGYNFRGIDDVMFGVRNPLLRHGVFVHFTYGKATPVTPAGEEGHDPHFFRLPIKATIRHAHSGEEMVSTFEGFGRQAGKGNVTNPDPRAIGQASSYGIKMWLLGEFMVAGGDDSADQAPKADGPAEAKPAAKPKAQPKDEDPELEKLRADLLKDIATLTVEQQATLKADLTADKVSVKTGDRQALEWVAKTIARIVDESKAEELNAPVEQEAAHVDPAPAPDRHLSAVPEQTDELPDVTDMQLCYLIASEGTDDGPSAKLDKGQQRTGLDYAVKVRGKKLRRDGLRILDLEGNVIADGTEAVRRFSRAG